VTATAPSAHFDDLTPYVDLPQGAGRSADAKAPGRAGVDGNAAAGAPGSGASERSRVLAKAAAGIRVRRRVALPVEQILLVAGSILFPLGVVFILLGWEGAAHTGRLYAQIDYLISGGLLGVGLLAAGGFLYFGYWLSRQLGESRRQNALTLQAIERLESAIRGAAANGGTHGANGAATRAAAGDTQGANGTGGASTRAANGTRGVSRPAEDTPTGEAPALLVATQHGSLMHRPDCPVVANKRGVKPMAAGTPGYGYCTMCDAAAVLA
jgi:hypothetical protein